MAIKTLEFPAIAESDKSQIKNLKILIISTLWNSDIVSSLVKGTKESLLDCGLKESQISQIQVPGSHS